MSIDLRDIATDEFRDEIQNSLSLATRFGVVFLDREGNQIGTDDTYTRLCKAINMTAEGRKACVETNCKAINLAFESQKASVYICHAGLVNIEIPLVYKGEHVGSITAGQVICNEEGYSKDPHQINWKGRDGFRELYDELPVMSKMQIEATTTALKNISHYIIQRFAYQKAQEDISSQRERLLIQDIHRKELEQQLASARFDALQKQMTPHFLFNVINSATHLIALKEYNTAQAVLNSFARMLRYSLKDSSTVITVDQEMSYIENYLSIQSIRFENRFTFTIAFDEQIRLMNIPFFSLQPFVENAVEHGLLQQTKKGIIAVTAKKRKNTVLFTIKDNGVGMSKEKIDAITSACETDKPLSDGLHIGIYNCYQRFKLLFRNQVKMKIQSKEGEGTVVYISIIED